MTVRCMFNSCAIHVQQLLTISIVICVIVWQNRLFHGYAKTMLFEFQKLYSVYGSTNKGHTMASVNLRNSPAVFLNMNHMMSGSVAP